MKGRKPEITAALDKPPAAPAWLPRYAKAERARVIPALVKARTLIVFVRFQQTRSPTVSNRDWSPVMHLTSVGLAGYRK